MKKITIRAPAKLNLNLHIFSKKKSTDYFPVKFINCQIDLSDEIILEKQKNKIEVFSDAKDVPLDEENLCFRAAHLLKEKVRNNELGVKIFIRKKIPVKSGLGGGSADGAQTLEGLLPLWKLKLTPRDIFKIALNLGTDVCYCLIGGICEVGGIGEKVRKLNITGPKIPIIVVTPKEKKPSTAWAYENLDVKRIGKNSYKAEKLPAAIKVKNINEIAKNLHNDFEYSIPKAYPMVNSIKKELLKSGALKAMLCGSGLSVFGIYQNKILARKAFNKLKGRFKKVILAQTL